VSAEAGDQDRAGRKPAPGIRAYFRGWVAYLHNLANRDPLLSFFRTPRGVFLLAAALAVAVYALLLSAPVTPDSAPGPAYDLIFGVNTSGPGRSATVALAPYVVDGTLYVQAERLPADEASGSTGVTLYRYYHQTGQAEPLPLLDESELEHLAGKKVFVVSATRQFTLSSADTSPDGYSLAEPNWVKADPIRNVLGNVVLLLLSGKVATITKRESAPRLANQAGSLAIRSKSPVFADEAETAFLLGWIVPAGPNKEQ
jgi:hypothetical protein